jgi:hypothetical protein
MGENSSEHSHVHHLFYLVRHCGCIDFQSQVLADFSWFAAFYSGEFGSFATCPGWEDFVGVGCSYVLFLSWSTNPNSSMWVCVFYVRTN